MFLRHEEDEICTLVTRALILMGEVYQLCGSRLIYVD